MRNKLIKAPSVNRSSEPLTSLGGAMVEGNEDACVVSFAVYRCGSGRSLRSGRGGETLSNIVRSALMERGNFMACRRQTKKGMWDQGGSMWVPNGSGGW